MTTISTDQVADILDIRDESGWHYYPVLPLIFQECGKSFCGCIIARKSQTGKDLGLDKVTSYRVYSVSLDEVVGKLRENRYTIAENLSRASYQTYQTPEEIIETGWRIER